MNSRRSCWSLVVVAAVLGLPATARAEAAPSLEVAANYLGVGVRGGQADATAGVIDSKIKLMDVGERTFSTRPALLMGGYDTEWRLPFTIEGKKSARGWSLFGGAGLAYNMDDLGKTDAMAVAGVDRAVSRRLILNLTINYIWQSDISDDDTEFLATLNYRF